MLSILMTAALFAAPPPTEMEFEFTEIRSAFVGDFLPIGTPDGRSEVFLILKSGDVLLASFDSITLSSESVTFSQDYDRGEENDNVRLTMEWDHHGSTVRVVTDCARYTMSKCVKIHANAVNLMQQAFPPTVLH